MPPSPVAVVCVGMAGSGKTTFMQRINSYLHQHKNPPYVMNLDPAVKSVPFDTNIDIRDSIDYKEVMAQYNLGPNGGIMTSLNLFATKVDQVLAILEKRTGSSTDTSTPADQASKPIQNIIIDTPGQIEVFVWSASGQILLSSLASTFPTVLAYVVDTPRTASTSTFMSNMIYACSILYKTKLPMILVFNKTDVQSADFAKEWMTDFDAFQAALKKEEETGKFGGSETEGAQSVGGSGYMGSLLNSMSLTLEEFYRHLSVVGVSSMTGSGVDDFFQAVREKADEFERDYRPELDRRQKAREKDNASRRDRELGRMMDDLNVEGGKKPKPAAAGSSSRPRKEEPETISDLEDDVEDDEEGMVEPDDDIEDDEDGLADRYRDATGNRPRRQAPAADDLSFARYIHRSNG